MKRLITLVMIATFILGACSFSNDNEVEEASTTNKATNEDKTNNETAAQTDLSEVERIKQEYPDYVETIELYETAIEEKWNMEKLDEHGISLDYEDPTATLPDDYGFQIITLEDERIPPLLATGTYINDLAYVHEIYTIDKGEAKRHFVDGIRTSLDIYEDATIVESTGNRFIHFYKINEQGEAVKNEAYEYDGANYVSDEKTITEDELTDMFTKLATDVGKVEYDFIPFIADKREAKEAGGSLSLDDMVEIKEDIYDELNQILLKENEVGQIFDQYHGYEEAEQIWLEGLDPSSSFYQDLYDNTSPQVTELVSENGMEAFINARFSRYYKTVAPDSFLKPDGDYDILEQTADHFKIKQTKVIEPQEVGGNSYLYIYHITFEQEDGSWKFADLETITYDEEIKI